MMPSTAVLLAVLGALGAPPLQQATGHLPAGADRPPQGFSVVLLVGDTQAGVGQDTVPAAARKALADLKDFLPYKSYRALDTQWIVCCGQTPSVTRLRGADNQDYDLTLTSIAAVGGKWAIHFRLAEPAAPTPPPAGYAGALHDKEIYVLTAQRTDLERKVMDLRQRVTETHPDVVALKAQIAEINRRLDVIRLDDLTRRVSTLRDDRRPTIDTSFTMDVGETVVVGTSRLKGDTALIALLTAIPQRPTALESPGGTR